MKLSKLKNYLFNAVANASIFVPTVTTMTIVTEMLEQNILKKSFTNY